MTMSTGLIKTTNQRFHPNIWLLIKNNPRDLRYFGQLIVILPSFGNNTQLNGYRNANLTFQPTQYKRQPALL